MQDESTSQLISSSDNTYQCGLISPADLAYIMFTSGSTGEPKGALLTHAAFSNLLFALQDQQLAPQQKVLCTPLPIFDAFLYDCLVALVTHGELHLTYEETRFLPTIIESLSHQFGLTYGVFLPQILDYLNPDISLQTIVSIGAPPHKTTIKKWAKPGRALINGFGITETGVCLTLGVYSDIDPSLIGEPIRNMQIFILDPTSLSLFRLVCQVKSIFRGPVSRWVMSAWKKKLVINSW